MEETLGVFNVIIVSRKWFDGGEEREMQLDRRGL